MRQQNISRGIKGIFKVYESALRYQYMISDKALYKARALAFWEKHGLDATLDAFKVKRRSLFNWKKQFNHGGRVITALNDKKKIPKSKRVRIWPDEIISEIKRLRWDHPNLGKDKLYPELKIFCSNHSLQCPSIPTIGRIIKDLGGLRIYPAKVSHFGKLKPIKRRKILRKPKDLKAEYPGHVVALDTVERIVWGKRRYVITFEDIYTRFGFAWSTTSHASLAAKEFFNLCRKVFPFPFSLVLTDNGSEFKKHFNQELNSLHLTHYHTYPKQPKMNAHCERFNRTIQEEFIDYHANELTDTQLFNRKLMDWLVWYNTRRVHYAFKNQLSPVQFILSLNQEQLPQECNLTWTHTST
jgi:transposase InsO family protein